MEGGRTMRRWLTVGGPFSLPVRYKSSREGSTVDLWSGAEPFGKD